MRRIGVAVRVFFVIALFRAALLGVQAEGNVGMFEAKPFAILKRTD
ncbi:MAG: hypothetical protein C5S49_08460 [Candidatus Methanogaster sp.]|nr:MAG: hypothetical protein C5S49_08460 [ANME-2 cluster archaeon]